MKITKFLVILLVIAAYFPAHAQRNDAVREIASFKGAEVIYMSAAYRVKPSPAPKGATASSGSFRAV